MHAPPATPPVTPHDGRDTPGAPPRNPARPARGDGGTARKPRGPLLYYVLAAFDVLTVTASLYLNHRMTEIYRASVAANRQWAQRSADYFTLEGLAADVNAPGNDVFDSHDVPRESERMRWALDVFRARVSTLRAELVEDVPRGEAEPLLARLDEIETAMSEMVVESALIFEHLRGGRSLEAGEHMATMDRKYARLLGAQRQLSTAVSSIQLANLEDQTRAASALQRFEYAIAALILLMVTAATAYGRKITRQAARDSHERSRHIAELEAADRSLREAHADLETRVLERTREIQLMQESIGREERMAAMGSLVAGVAHEVRNPLFGISSTLDAFEARHGGDGSFQKYFSVLRRETDRLSHLMRDLLEYGKPARLDLADASLAEVADEAVRMCDGLARANEVRVVKAREFGPARVRIDRARMVQVLQNLVENAIQHSPRGGSVVVRGGRDGEAGWTETWCSVEDSGPGFPPEDLARVFEPFFSRRSGGTGMGLSIAQRIVGQHGGAIEATNQPGGGAVVTVRLPEVPAESTPGSATGASSVATSSARARATRATGGA